MSSGDCPIEFSEPLDLVARSRRGRYRQGEMPVRSEAPVPSTHCSLPSVSTSAETTRASDSFSTEGGERSRVITRITHSDDANLQAVGMNEQPADLGSDVPEKAKRPHFSARYKPEILAAYDRLPGEERARSWRRGRATSSCRSQLTATKEVVLVATEDTHPAPRSEGGEPATPQPWARADRKTCEVARGRIAAADRNHNRDWLGCDDGRPDVEIGLEGCSGWSVITRLLETRRSDGDATTPVILGILPEELIPANQFAPCSAAVPT
jgi:hypothetical protein